MLVAVTDLLVSELQGPLEQVALEVEEEGNIEVAQNFGWVLQR